MTFDESINVRTLGDCTETDAAEWRLAASRLPQPPPALENLVCVSLSVRDAPRCIADHRSSGRTVLALATRAQIAARRAGMEAGATEMLTTGPIAPAELAGRLALLSGRCALPSDFQHDADTGRLRIAAAEHDLRPRENAIVSLLIEAGGGVVSHEDLLALWGAHACDPQYLRVAIRNLRRKIEPDPEMPRYILSEPALGYRFGNGIDLPPL